ncbi:hypothetical protein OAN94_04785 [Verrucomicrobiales bacterium]|nr:hypothetical protein [Verrucomicrobiales bacterium]
MEDVRFLEYFSPEKNQLGLPGLHRLRQEVGLDESWFIDGAGAANTVTTCSRSFAQHW